MTEFESNEVQTSTEIETTEINDIPDVDLFGDETEDNTDDLEFDDFNNEADSGNDENAEDESIEDAQNQEQNETESEIKYTLKHLDDTREVNLEELIALGQKGLDYDRIRGGYDSYKQYSNTIDSLKALAEENGVTVDQLVNDVVNNNREMRLQARINEIMDAEIVSEDVARRMAEQEQKIANLEKQGEHKRQEQEQSNAEMEQRMAEVKKLTELYPETAQQGFQIPQPVLDNIQNNGVGLVEAYQHYLINQKDTKIKQMEQGEKNRKNNIGSLKSNSKAEPDEFLDALFD